MTQDQLSKIFDTIVKQGKTVGDGWIAKRHSDIDTVSQTTGGKFRAWERNHENGPWEEVESLRS